MRTTNLANDQESGSDGVKLSVLLMHETLAAGLRGKRALDQVAESLELKAQFFLRLWKFALLHEPALQRLALDDARQANIIVLAMQDGAELPLAVRAWLEAWLQGDPHVPRALVISLDTSARGLPGPNPVLNYARAVAGPAGVELFPHFGDTPHSSWDLRIGNSQTSNPIPGLLQILDLPEPHLAWGINE